MQILIQGFLIVILLSAQQLISIQIEHRVLNSAEVRGKTAADGVINGLNILMVTKVGKDDVISDQKARALFIQKMGESEDIKEMRVIRGKGVDDEYDGGLPQEKPVDDMDRRVLASGKTEFLLIRSNDSDASLRAVVPFIAKKNFRTTNCLKCHKVEEGSVLGAASVVIDIKDDLASIKKDNTWVWIGQGALQILLFFLIGFVVRRKQAEQELRIAATAFDAQEGIFVTNVDGIILRVNQAFCQMTGYSKEEAIGKTPALLNSGRHDSEFYRLMWETLARDHFWQGEIWNRRKNGEVYPEWLNITAVTNAEGQVTKYIASFSDITQHKAADDKIKRLAFYDPLTQLPNRRLLNDRLSQAMAASKRSGCYGAVMFLDLDNFKPLNDTHGHEVGDLLLIEVVDRLKSCVREMDTVARFGGDEFVVMLSELDVDKAESIITSRDRGRKNPLHPGYPLFVDHQARGEGR